MCVQNTDYVFDACLSDYSVILTVYDGTYPDGGAKQFCQSNSAQPDSCGGKRLRCALTAGIHALHCYIYIL